MVKVFYCTHQKGKERSAENQKEEERRGRIVCFQIDHLVFSTSDISYQMCYCCRKLDFETFSGEICEAVWGRGRPGSSHWLRDLPEPIRGARPHTASQISLKMSQIRPPTASHGLPLPRPPTICHVISLSQSGSTASHESPIWDSASQTPGEAMRLAVKSVRRARGSYCLARSPISERPCSDSHGLTDRPHRFESPIGLTDRTLKSVRPICEAVGVRARPLTIKWCDLWGRSDSQILWGRRVGGRSDFGLYRVRQCV